MTPNDPSLTKQNSASSDENKNAIDNHKKAAKHLEEAAKYHHVAAKYHEAENYEKALEYTLKAKGHYALANENQRDVNIYHSLHG